MLNLQFSIWIALSLILYVVFQNFLRDITNSRAEVSMCPQDIVLLPVELLQPVSLMLIQPWSSHLLYPSNNLLNWIAWFELDEDMNMVFVKLFAKYLEVWLFLTVVKCCNDIIMYLVETFSSKFCWEYQMISKSRFCMTIRLVFYVFHTYTIYF